ncbi:conserved hypothetical protein [Ricinus communis]|uniref:RNase H type-1 domain-containing protein n=1 Tax=Ricinus communis TaxID=3988 RepID=B9T4W7_RICCO|nr:conserved hypothetical protein [Ricinus communis]
MMDRIRSFWCWKGPYRIQTFLWLLTQERLPTNELCFHRKQKGFRRVDLELDSLEVVRAISADLSLIGNCGSLLAQIKTLMSRSWDVSCAHVLKEANKCANWLAHAAP